MPRTSFRTPGLMLEPHPSISISVTSSTLFLGTRACSHAGRCQVGVFVLEFSIQGDAPPLPVVGQQGEQQDVFLERRPRRNRFAEERYT